MANRQLVGFCAFKIRREAAKSHFKILSSKTVRFTAEAELAYLDIYIKAIRREKYAGLKIWGTGS